MQPGKYLHPFVMGSLTETEIFDCLATNFRLAAQHADDLARLPAKGPTYRLFRDELKLIEGACRQASVWREDTRWLKIGLMMAEAHKRAGGWLRGIKAPDGSKRSLRAGELHPLFTHLADNLRAGLAAADRVRTAATGRIGMILPEVARGPHRDTRPAGWNATPSGLIVPAGVAAQ